MQVFEFLFNPGKNPSFVFNTYGDEQEKTKSMGGLYMIGTIKNALPSHKKFLDNLAGTLEKSYHSLKTRNREKALKETLKSVNIHLEKISKSGDTSWLGNLSFAAVSIKNLELNFTKIGKLSVVLLRAGRVIDIDKKIEKEKKTTNPLKTFGSIISTELKENDEILILNPEVYNYFTKNKILEKLALDAALNKGNLKENLKKIKSINTIGACLLINLKREFLKPEKNTFSEGKGWKAILKDYILSPFVYVFKKLRNLRLPELRFEKKDLLRNASLILILLVLLVSSFFVFRYKQQREVKAYREKITNIDKRVFEAESLLPKSEGKADELFKQTLNDLSSLKNKEESLPKDLHDTILKLRERITASLYKINKIETVNPEVVYEFDSKKYVPIKLVLSNNSFYFFNPLSKDMFVLDENKNENIVSLNEKVSFALPFNDSVIAYIKPDKLIILKNNVLLNTLNLKPPYENADFSDLSIYASNLYFLDSKEQEIVAYPYAKNSYGPPRTWILPNVKKPTAAKAAAVNESVFILGNQEVDRYYKGDYKETFKFQFFPEPKNLTKIYSEEDLPFLYLFDPENNRIIILSKSGKLLKQIESDEFSRPLDFTVAKDGTIYVLSGSLKVLRITSILP